MDLQEKYDHARAADQTLQHPVMRDLFKQYGERVKREGGTPEEINAILELAMNAAHHAAQVARAQALGMDPEGLRTTPAEHAKLAAMLPPKMKEESDLVDHLKARAEEAAALAEERGAGS